MADTKISALTSVTTPLAGTEVVPIVQSGITKKVAISDLTAERAVATGALTVTGNTKLKGDLQVKGSSTLANVEAFITATDTLTKIHASSSSGVPKTLQLLGSGGSSPTMEITSSNATIYTNLVIGTSGKGIDFSATAGTGTSELLADYEEGTWTPNDQSGAGLTFTIASARYIKVGKVVNIWLRVGYPATASASAAQIGGLPFTSITTLATGLDVSGGVTVMLADTTSCMGYVNSSSTKIGSLGTFTAPGTSITNATLSGQNIYLFGTYYSAD